MDRQIISKDIGRNSSQLCNIFTKCFFSKSVLKCYIKAKAGQGN